MDSNILDNFEKPVFYHGTTAKAVESIARDGFRVWFVDDESGPFAARGHLGTGLYVTCNWRMALWFGPSLLRVAIRPGTRLLNAALPPDGKILDSIQREFGRDVLRKAPWKVLPKNKNLTLRELISMFRFHYWFTWEKEFNRDEDGFYKWPRQRELHRRLLEYFRSMLIRYGFHGYGNSEDDNGIVVFAEDRLVLKDVVTQIPFADHSALRKTGFRQFRSLGDVQKFVQGRG